MSASDKQNSSTGSSPPAAWTPLKNPLFRILWITWLTANVCMWMNDVAAAWLMTTLTTTPVMVALVQAASSLPMFLLGVPSGALADIVDRRGYLIFTQVWLAASAVVLCVCTFAGLRNPVLLLVLTFANGVGLAMRWPVYAAIVPEVVPRTDLPAALALNAVSMNASRIIGPSIAGAIIATFGNSCVFFLNALLSVAAAITLLRWRHQRIRRALPSERFFGAIRVGLQYVRQSPGMLIVLYRTGVFFSMSIALLALLPLLAKELPGGDARTFTLLLASMGTGAVSAAAMLPRLRRRMTRDELVHWGTLLHAIATLFVAFVPHPYLAALGMVAAGTAWISVANSLTVTAQLALPDWVKARGMSIYQMSMMGGSALGAALWGQVATISDVRTALVLAAIGAVTGLALLRRVKLGASAEQDLTAVGPQAVPEVAIPIEAEQGPVLVTIEYRIDPAQAAEFAEVMHESRRARLRNGALSWQMFRDTADPGCFIESFVDESWVQHMRQHERMTAFDLIQTERKLAFHLEDVPPVVRHYIAQPLRA